MALPAPRLDDRHFQDIVDEAKRLIPRYCEEWTDHNVSDPGVTMIELFAWMTDMILYRLNQVPTRHYVKFMDMLGIRLKEPIPATVPVTFWLSAPQDAAVMIPAGTEVASTQTETEPSIVFTTDVDSHIWLPGMQSIMSRVASSQQGQKQYNNFNLRRMTTGFEGQSVFSGIPQVDDALYFGFESNLSHHILGLNLDCDPAGGAGIDPTLPPYIWEASTGKAESKWERCEVEFDTTKGLNTSGSIRLHLPSMGRFRANSKSLYWIRARIIDHTTSGETDMRPYRVSPRLREVQATSWGGIIPTTHAQAMLNENMGRSDGSPGQFFQLQLAPILTRREDEEYLEVLVADDDVQRWHEVADFANSGARDRHYTLNSATGEVRFGPAVRQPDGTMKLYGAIPPRGAIVQMKKYRYGGSQKGNVQTGVLNTLKTAIPFVSRVLNRVGAQGGMDAESLEAAMMRTPELLRSRQRAVTESDYEFLAREALRAQAGRVKCLQPRPSAAGRVAAGQIYVLVIPRILRPAGYLEPTDLQLPTESIERLTEYLDERRLLTSRLDVRTPAYRWVSIKVSLRAAPGYNQSDVEAEVLSLLYRFLNPIVGGPDGKGWPFGRDVYVSDVYQSLQQARNVQFIRSVEMRSARPGGAGTGQPVETIEIVEHGVVASGIHEVEFV